MKSCLRVIYCLLRKICKWKEHKMSISADPFDHVDVQDIQ